MKKCFLFFVFFNAVSIPNIYASCYDVSSCSRELDDEENRRNSTQSCTHFLKSKNPISDSYDVCDYIYGSLALSSMSNFRSSGWEEVYENCYGSVWCIDRPTSSLDIADSSLPSSYSGGGSYRHRHTDCDDATDYKDLCFYGLGNLQEKTHVYNKEAIINDSRIKYWGNITFGKPIGYGFLYYHDSELGPIAIVAEWKHGRPDGTGTIFSKYGCINGKWNYGNFDIKSQLFMSEKSESVMGKFLEILEKVARIKFQDKGLTENLSTKIIDANSKVGKKLLSSLENERRQHIVSDY